MAPFPISYLRSPIQTPNRAGEKSVKTRDCVQRLVAGLGKQGVELIIYCPRLDNHGAWTALPARVLLFTLAAFQVVIFNGASL